MQKQEYRGAFRAGFAIKDIEFVNPNRFVVYRRRFGRFKLRSCGHALAFAVGVPARHADFPRFDPTDRQVIGDY